MKALVTGANGTVGKALAAYLEKQKITVIPWDRTKYPVNNFQKMVDLLINVSPDVLFHLAIASKNTGLRDEERLVNKVWPKRLAKYTLGLGIKFVFTSSVMVFSDKAKGPFTINSSPNETDGYGKYKRDMEELLPLLNSNTIVVRLGWQI